MSYLFDIPVKLLLDPIKFWLLKLEIFSLGVALIHLVRRYRCLSQKWGIFLCNHTYILNITMVCFFIQISEKPKHMNKNSV